MTKDELIGKVELLQGQKHFLEGNDKTLREEISKTLGAPSVKKSTYGDSEQIVYSWHEIFREIGMLLEIKKRGIQVSLINTLSDRLGKVESEVFEDVTTSPPYLC